MNALPSGKSAVTQVFWGEIAPCEHMIQIYAEEAAFLDSLEGFICGGLRLNESVIIIATAAHLNLLESRLLALGFDLRAARERDQYITLEAQPLLEKFMVAGWPNDNLFKQSIKDLLARARKGGRRVRAFGEMVALLWSQGFNGATVRLEHLWHDLCKTETFCLFCAYPRIGFTQNSDASIKEICAAHSKVI